MSTGKTITATAQQNETLDALVWRVLGVGAGVVEQVLDLNRGLADIGLFLPEGHIVTLPALSSAAVAERPLIQLWD